tara:strand:- start:4313 stop:5275 length:963 start_codon:yes stop_codon:yes gene_type:complete
MRLVNTMLFNKSAKFKAIIMSIAITSFGYLLFSLWVGLDGVILAISNVGWIGIFIILSLSLVNYGLRFLRWQLYLKVFGSSLIWLTSLKIYISGFALTATPGKIGEAFRGILLKPYGISYLNSFAAFFSERLSDLFSIVILTLFGFSIYPQSEIAVYMCLLLVALIFFVISQKRIILFILDFCQDKKSRFFDLIGYVFKIIFDARSCHAPKILFSATILSLIAWAAEAYALFLILYWMGLDISLEFAFFIYAISMLVGAISFMPGGLGGAEAIMITLLLWKGASSTEAVAATILIRSTTLWFAIALGCITLLFNRKKLIH